jgi:hypothetical protein
MGENIFNYNIVTNGDMSSNIESDIVDLSRADGFSIVAVITGSPVGTFSVKMGNTDADLTVDPDSVVAVSGVDKIAYSRDINTFDKVQCFYTATSGSGTLTVRINAKGDPR